MLFVLTAAMPALPRYSSAGGRPYPWLSGKPAASIASRIAPPDGHRRVRVTPGSFGQWLRHLPLKPAGAAVLLHDGRKKPHQDVHAAVIDIDVGQRDLQQCADAVMRLRAEYLFSMGRFENIHFRFTSGHEASYTRWRDDYRPTVRGSSVSWSRRADKNSSYGGFREYLKTVFAYAGTLSLSRELPPRNVSDMRIGDVFIRGGSPGHAVIVVDMAADAKGQRAFLLAQSYMPAQDIHVLKNPADANLSPWYSLPRGTTLHTPEWTFRTSDLAGFGTAQHVSVRPPSPK